MTAAKIAGAPANRKARTDWMARCPGQDDGAPTLSIRGSNIGMVLARWSSALARNTLVLRNDEYAVVASENEVVQQ
jgi:hypothetical protein